MLRSQLAPRPLYMHNESTQHINKEAKQLVRKESNKQTHLKNQINSNDCNLDVMVF